MAFISWNLIVVDNSDNECTLSSGLSQGVHPGFQNTTDPDWEQIFNWTFNSDVTGGSCSSYSYIIDPPPGCDVEVFDAQCSLGNIILHVAGNYTPPNYGCTDASACNYGEVGDCTYPQTGDINLDCELNVVDAVNMVEIALQESPQTEQQILMGDMNLDGGVNVVDIVLLIALILGS